MGPNPTIFLPSLLGDRVTAWAHVAGLRAQPAAPSSGTFPGSGRGGMGSGLELGPSSAPWGPGDGDTKEVLNK